MYLEIHEVKKATERIRAIQRCWALRQASRRGRYARFSAQAAAESQLQTLEDIEIIVVNDGTLGFL